MQRTEALSIEQIRQFLAASSDIGMEAQSREEVYAWIEAILRTQDYGTQPKAVRGLILQYIVKLTGLSTAQVDWLGDRTDWFRSSLRRSPSSSRPRRLDSEVRPRCWRPSVCPKVERSIAAFS